MLRNRPQASGGSPYGVGKNGSSLAVGELAERLVGPGSPFELVSSSVAGTPVRTFRHGPASLGDVYRRTRSATSRACLAFGSQTLSYGDILSWANGLARLLRDRYGVSPGQRVGIVLPTSPHWLVAFVSVTALGGVATLIESSTEPRKVITALATARCVVAVVDASTAQLLSDCGLRCPVVVARLEAVVKRIPGDGAPFDKVDPLSDMPSLNGPIEPEFEALIAFTSGSTGPPKGVVSSHRAVITGMMNMMLGSALATARNGPARLTRGGVGASPSSLLLAPFTHVAGYSHLILMMWVSGMVAALPTWELNDALEIIEREKLRTISGASPSLLRQLLRSDPYRNDLSSVSAVGVHGSALRRPLLNEIAGRLPQAAVVTGYGMTETNGSICVAVGREVVESPQSSGPLVPSVDARIVDENGRDLPTGIAGEIWLRGAMLMSGYCTTQVGVSPLNAGWYRTEDWGRFDSRGNLLLVGRREDLVNFFGGRISGAKLERLVCEHGGFDDAVAFGDGDSRDQRVVVFAARGRPGAVSENLVAEGLAKETELSGCRVEVRVIDRMPLTTSGKIDRQALRCQIVSTQFRDIRNTYA